MKRFDVAWSRLRDVILTLLAVLLAVVAVTQPLQPQVSLAALGLAGALVGVPIFRRTDERARKEGE